MTESSIVRQNLMDDKFYSPYCSNPDYKQVIGGCHNPRTVYNKSASQFVCPSCGWTSEFDQEFVDRYKQKHNL